MKERDTAKAQGDNKQVEFIDKNIAAWKQVQEMSPTFGKRAEFLKAIPKEQAQKDPAYMAAEKNAAKALEDAAWFFANPKTVSKDSPEDQKLMLGVLNNLDKAFKPLEKEMERLVAGGKEEGGAAGLAAATNAQYKQAADLSRDIIQNAFVATSGAVDKKEDDNKKAVAMVIDLPNVIQQNVEKGMLAAMNKKKEAMPQNDKPAFAKGVA